MSRKRKSRSRSRRQKSRKPPPGLPVAAYREAVREADRALVEGGIEIGADTWQAVAREWFVEEGRDQEELAGYIAAHEGRLGVRWARDLMRLWVFIQEDDFEAILAHYARAMIRYPRCALVDLWVASVMAHHSTNWWQARSMLLYTAEELPGHARPCHELGFQHYLLGDFAGAVAWFDKALARLTEDEVDLRAQTHLNRAVSQVAAGGDPRAAIAEVKHALRLRPDYALAKSALRVLRSRRRRKRRLWTPG